MMEEVNRIDKILPCEVIDDETNAFKVRNILIGSA
jgi:hypothetical protein